MLRLTEVASQSETFSKRVLEKTTSQSTCLHGWPNPATTAECFLLTGRLYWLLDAGFINWLYFFPVIPVFVSNVYTTIPVL